MKRLLLSLLFSASAFAVNLTVPGGTGSDKNDIDRDVKFNSKTLDVSAGTLTLADSQIPKIKVAGISNVDNTSDANKPVSTAQLAALNTKANLSGGNTLTGAQVIGSGGSLDYSGTGTVNAKALQGTTPTAAGLTLLDDASATAQRTTLGLGNVDDTSDANKPVSTAQQTALDLKAPVASPSFTGNATFPVTTSSSSGVIKYGSQTLFHTYADATADGLNVFGGPNAGNFTLSPAGGASFLGSRNTTFGRNAGEKLTTGWQNDLFGNNAGGKLTTGTQNSYFGNGAGQESTTSVGNAGFGNFALNIVTTGGLNNAVGEGAMRFLTTGSRNNAIGHGAGYNLVTGSDNIFIGETAGLGSPSGLNNSMAFGTDTACNGDNQIVLGNSLHTSVYFGSLNGSASLFARNATFIGTEPSVRLDPTNANGVAQIYAIGSSTTASSGIFRLIRGNGAGGGLLDNGLNLDIFGGFQVRANQLGGSGDPINLLGAPVVLDNQISATKAVLGGTGTSLSLNPSDAGGVNQIYAIGSPGVGSFGIWRMVRGNGGGGGYLNNGLNIDTFDGFQVRVNQLGGSGGPIKLLGGPVTVDDALTSTVITGTAPLVVASTTRVSNLNVATAGTADALTTARSINGVSFNGTANIVTRYQGSFSGVGTASTVFTVTIGTTMANSTYKVMTEATNVLSAPVRYITNKTTTTFDVVYLTGLTGTVEFDWLVIP